MKTRTLLRAGILAALALVGGAALQAVRNNERIIAQGRVVLVELAPVDPRSLMQGDYMMLRFAIDDALPDFEDSVAGSERLRLQTDLVVAF